MPIIRHQNGREAALLGQVTFVRYSEAYQTESTFTKEKAQKRRFENLDDSLPDCFSWISLSCVPLFFVSMFCTGIWQNIIISLCVLAVGVHFLAYALYWINDNFLTTYQFARETEHWVSSEISIEISDLYSGTNSFNKFSYSERDVNNGMLKISVGTRLYVYTLDNSVIRIHTTEDVCLFACDTSHRSIEDHQKQLAFLCFTDAGSPFRKPDITFDGPAFSVAPLASDLAEVGGSLGPGFSPWTSYLIGIASVIAGGGGNGGGIHVTVNEIGKPMINPFISQPIFTMTGTTLQSNHLVSVFFQGNDPIIIFDLNTNKIDYFISWWSHPYIASTEPIFLDDAQRLEVLAIEELKRISLYHADRMINGVGVQQSPYV